jgi:acyl-CoA thioesterase
MFFAEAEGFSHLHVHVVPRMPDLPPDQVGPAVLTHIGAPESAWVPEDERDAFGRAMQSELGELASPLPSPQAPDISDEDDVARRSAEAMLSADVASSSAGVALVDVGPGRAVMTMTLTPAMLNGHGIAHGGYVFLLADSAFAVACNSHGVRTVAAGCDISYLGPVEAGDVLTAVAEERVPAGRNGICDVTVRRADGMVVAEMRGRSRTIGGSLLGGE